LGQQKYNCLENSANEHIREHLASWVFPGEDATVLRHSAHPHSQVSGAREDGDENVVEKPTVALSSSPSQVDGEKQVSNKNHFPAHNPIRYPDSHSVIQAFRHA
jgi:hypothetical protein